MKKYRLKQWYPSLDVTLNVGDVIEITGRVESFYGGIIYEFTNTTGDYTDVGFIQECEFNNPDFWELIEEKKPLFITEDGVQMLDRDSIVWMVRNNTLEKIKIHSIHLNEYDFEHKVFAHESNADEYIWRNKRVFSYNDMVTAKKSVVLDEEDIVRIAKERIGNEN